MSLPRIVAFSASAGRPSRTRALVEAVAEELGRLRRVELSVYDLLDAGPDLCVAAREDLPPAARALIEAIEGADGLIVGTPVYQGSYAGLFKHVFDFVQPEAMLAKPVALTATGGGLRHALVVEHALRPLFGFFAAHVAPTAVYACSAEMDGLVIADAGVAARVRAAAAELSDLVGIGQAGEGVGLR
ncbi:FMN reductase (NADPH) [Methylobacterium dankookense]|uniref:FMN reductase (NADPH) n=1 Tax=Methylobacterium dankookense TaxID=560405 RepID=A0A564FUT7_9HYPH|nr:NADH-dependent FMN reductase SfnF [Methylobacterium dankookense]VUF11843.1 FMN reductase (NADPH) [Methylobacterium dankookense]